MKKVFAIFFALNIALVLFANGGQFEPLANEFETSKIELVKKESNVDSQIKILREASLDSRAGAAIYFNLANLYASKKDYKNACAYFKKSLEMLPTFYQAKYNLALSQFAQNDFENALKTFGEALSLLQKDSQKIFRYIGICHFKLSNFSSALTAFENSLILAPLDIEMLRLKAVCLQKLSREAELKIFLEELIKANPKDVVFWRMLARLNYTQGDFKNAATSAESIVLLGGATSQDFELLTYSYLNLKMYEKAAEYAKQANLPSETLCELAKIFVKNGRFEIAQRFLDVADSSTAQYWQTQGLIEKNSGRFYANSFEKAYKLDPTNETVLLELAAYYLNNKQFDRAKSMYESAQKQNPTLSKIGIGNVEVAQGNFKKAAEIFMSLYRETKDESFLNFAKKLEALKYDAK